MDFDLTDWAADSHVLKLDKQLFGPKEQLTVCTSDRSSKKHKKKKLLKTIDKNKNATQVWKNAMETEDSQLPKHQLLKKEKLKKLKKEKLLKRKFSNVDDNVDSNSETVLQKGKEKLQKTKQNTANGKHDRINSENVVLKKKKKLMKSKSDRTDEENLSQVGPLKKKEKLLKRKHSDDADDKESEKEKGTRKKKRKRSLQNLEGSQTEDVANNSKLNEELNTSKNKRKKKKKSSSKKNKYKHLDEERARLKESLGLEESAKKVPEILSNKFVEKKQSDTPKTKTKLNVSSGSTSEGKLKKKKKNFNKQHLESSQKQITVDNKFSNHKVESEGKDLNSSKKMPFNLSKLNKVLSPNNHATNDKNNVTKEKSIERRTDTQHSPDKKNKQLSAKETSTDTPHGSEKRKDKPVSLRDRMMDQLKSARFRFINEQLYTRSGSEAVELFREDEESFHCYHEGFQNQVEKWPTNPVNIIIKQIISGPKTAVVGDFGCGDAKIARSVPNKVHSFDLVALNEHVTVCNIQKVPLKNNALDIAVFCLSLMGTNLAEYLEEANRVLKKGGTLMIAEVTSRIEKFGKFIRNIERMGFRVNNKDTSNEMFVLVDFMKIGTPGDRLPEITLDPCVYKKR